MKLQIWIIVTFAMLLFVMADNYHEDHYMKITTTEKTIQNIEQSVEDHPEEHDHEWHYAGFHK